MIKLLVILLIIAILFAMGSALYRSVVSGPIGTGGGGGGGGGGGLNPASVRLMFLTAPTQLVTNVDTEFIVRLERFNGATYNWDAWGNQPTMIGAVMPASVTIVQLNGSAPAGAQPLPASVLIPGLSGGGTAVPTTSRGDGTISVVLRGSQPEDQGSFTAIYVISTTEAKYETVPFSVRDP